MNLLSEVIVKKNNKIEYSDGNISDKQVLEKEFTIPELSSELNEWYKGLPEFDYLSFPWTLEEFFIVGKNYLLTQLGGYRFIPEKGKWKDLYLEGKWNANWIIIATWADNPLIADIGHKGTPIYYVIDGEFPPKLLVDSLEKLDYFLGIWLNLHENKFCDEGSYLPSFYELLDKEWRKELNDNEMEEIYEYMPILMAEEEFESEEDEEDHKDNNTDNNTEGIMEGRIIIEDLGSNQQKVFLAIKNEIGLGFGETKEILKKNPAVLCQGYIGNMINFEKLLSSLGATVTLEKIK